MPKPGSPLLSFITESLVKRTYPNLYWYFIPGEKYTFVLEHVRKDYKDATIANDFNNIYEDYRQLKIKSGDTPKCSGKILLNSALKNDKGKFIKRIKKDPSTILVKRPFNIYKIIKGYKGNPKYINLDDENGYFSDKSVSSCNSPTKRPKNKVFDEESMDTTEQGSSSASTSGYSSNFPEEELRLMSPVKNQQSNELIAENSNQSTLLINEAVSMNAPVLNAQNLYSVNTYVPGTSTETSSSYLHNWFKDLQLIPPVEYRQSNEFVTKNSNQSTPFINQPMNVPVLSVLNLDAVNTYAGGPSSVSSSGYSSNFPEEVLKLMSPVKNQQSNELITENSNQSTSLINEAVSTNAPVLNAQNLYTVNTYIPENITTCANMENSAISSPKNDNWGKDTVPQQHNLEDPGMKMQSYVLRDMPIDLTCELFDCDIPNSLDEYVNNNNSQQFESILDDENEKSMEVDTIAAEASVLLAQVASDAFPLITTEEGVALNDDHNYCFKNNISSFQTSVSKTVNQEVQVTSVMEPFGQKSQLNTEAIGPLENSSETIFMPMNTMEFIPHVNSMMVDVKNSNDKDNVDYTKMNHPKLNAKENITFSLKKSDDSYICTLEASCENLHQNPVLQWLCNILKCNPP